MESQIESVKGQIEQAQKDAEAIQAQVSEYRKQREEANTKNKAFFEKREQLNEQIANWKISTIWGIGYKFEVRN